MTDVAVLATDQLPGDAPGSWSRGRPYLFYALQRLVQAVIVIIAAYVLSFILITVVPGNAIATVLGSPQSGLSPLCGLPSVVAIALPGRIVISTNEST